jgi:hypothetical protein
MTPKNSLQGWGRNTQAAKRVDGRRAPEPIKRLS